MNVVVIVFCFAKWLLWKQIYADTCGMASYRMSCHVFINHVIQSFYGTRTIISCLDHCEDNPSCHSINWYSKTGLCQLNNGTHLSYPEGLVPDSTGSYMLYSLRPMVTCSNKFCGNGEVCLMKKDGISYRCQSGCKAALGMQDGRIKDSQLSASSSVRAELGPPRARLHSTVPDGSWTAMQTKIGEYLQIDLLKMHIISQVATQGRYGRHSQWITKYYLQHSQDGASWESYKYGGNVKHFEGNRNQNSVVAHTLPIPIPARLIRFLPLQWYGGFLSMRVEIYGCNIL